MQKDFDAFWEMKFELRIETADGVLLKCSVVSRCMVVYHKAYTPILFHVNPPVVYSGADIEIWFNPKGVISKIENLNTDDMPFVNAKIDKAHINFEGKVDSETKIQGWVRNRIHGEVTDQPISLSSKLNMLWEVGNSLKQAIEMTTCTFDQKNCYEVKSIPVIHSISAASGFTTGKQNLMIKGFGLDNATLSIEAAGEVCTPTFISKEQVNCTTGAASSASVALPQAGQ